MHVKKKKAVAGGGRVNKSFGVMIGSTASLAPGNLSTGNRCGNWGTEVRNGVLTSLILSVISSMFSLSSPWILLIFLGSSPAFLSIFWAWFLLYDLFHMWNLKQTVLPTPQKKKKKTSHRYRELIGGHQRWEVGKGGRNRWIVFSCFSLNKLNKK